MGQKRRPVRQQIRTAPGVPVQDPPPAAAVPQTGPVLPVALVPRAVDRLGSEQRGSVFEAARLSREIADRQAQLTVHVLDARARGVSWAVIGWAVGTSGEAARQRWGSAVATPAPAAPAR